MVALIKVNIYKKNKI